ncbi:MAG: serine O-acetyltransferase EpsC [Phycisphaeraceae bacterium]
MPDSADQPDPHAAARINDVVEQFVRSYQADDRTHHLDATFLPNRARTIELLEMIRRVLFPGFFDEHRVTTDNVRFHVGELLTRIDESLYEQIRQALRYDKNRTGEPGAGDNCAACDTRARDLTTQLLAGLPELRRRLALDVQAAFDGDPAAQSTDETIFCYPGIDATFIHRVAHELYKLDVPLLPRIISEYAHNETGIDIHPGASIGDSFFIDHGTGVVIGETCIIGDRVKLYQGVTLGALSTKGGQAWRGRKRHPTIENDVTIYGGAIILGGETVVGEGSTIGGSVFITSSVPPGHTVTMKQPELKLSAKKVRRKKRREADSDIPNLDLPTGHDFQI